MNTEVLQIVSELGKLALAITLAGSHVATTPRLRSDICSWLTLNKPSVSEFACFSRSHFCNLCLDRAKLALDTDPYFLTTECDCSSLFVKIFTRTLDCTNCREWKAPTRTKHEWKILSSRCTTQRVCNRLEPPLTTGIYYDTLRVRSRNITTFGSSCTGSIPTRDHLPSYLYSRSYLKPQLSATMVRTALP
jgi:hypothetical protein